MGGSSLIPRPFGGGEEKMAWYTFCACVKCFCISFVYVPVNSYCRVFNLHTLLLGVYVKVHLLHIT